MKIVAAVFLLLLFHGIAQEVKLPKLNMETEKLEFNLSAFHDYHVGEFVKAEGFGQRRVIIMPKQIDLVVDGDKYKLRDMKLLSVTDRKKAVVWEFPKRKGGFSKWTSLSRERIENGQMDKRKAVPKELKDLEKLKKGEEWIVAKDQRHLKIAAPLIGQAACIRCHEDYKEGDFMGAFIYSLTVVDKVPFKNE
ncbi:MAG: DUF3365 domain-containing protein [Lentisphaeraceae bacterium]|nr:DUF3365 domain-containing protein [Lentisphaeraceae bacterium]